MTREASYERIVLKLGGEALARGGENGSGIDPLRAKEIAEIVKQVKDGGTQVVIVIGAGNLWRGEYGREAGMDRATADYMGMIATVMNAMALRDALEQIGVETRVQSAIEMKEVAEPYIRLRAIRHLEKGRVVIMAAGTGNPYFTTDSAAALRANEIHADVLIKATKVDGVYDDDPKRNPDAQRYTSLTFAEALNNEQVRVMDKTAITLCMENKLPILVLNLWEDGALQRAVRGDETVGTLIKA